MARDLSLALRIRADASNARKEVRGIKKELRAAGKTGRRAGRDLKPFGSALDRLRASAVSLRGVLIGLGAITLFRTALRNTVRQEQALRQVENTLRQTGNAVGFTTDELARMASELQSVTTVGDEEILELQNQLLAFSNITGEEFQRTLAVVLDFAETTGRGASQSIRTLAVAMNDPLTGMARLRQAGVDLTESQKALIRQLAESGDRIGAQRVLLDALETAYGGAARTARDTLGGAISGLQNSFGDLLEAPGGMLNMQSVLELITESIKGLQDAGGDLADDDSIQTFGESAAEIFAFVADAARSSSVVIRNSFGFAGESLGAGAAQLVQLLQGNFSAARRIGDEWLADQRDRLNQVENFNASAMREQLQQIREGLRQRAEERAREREIREGRIGDSREQSQTLQRVKEEETQAIRNQLADQVQAYDAANKRIEELQQRRLKIEEFFADARDKLNQTSTEDDPLDVVDMAGIMAQARQALATGDFEQAIELSQQASEALQKLKEAGEFEGELGRQQSLGFLAQLERIALEAADAEQRAAESTRNQAQQVIETLLGRAQELNNIQVDFDTEDAQNNAEALRQQIQQRLDENPVVLPVVLQEDKQGEKADKRAGELLENLPTRAEGGPIDGPGTETSDSVLARLSKNEYVINAKAVRHYGERFMDNINKRRLPGFADGGLVGVTPDITRPSTQMLDAATEQADGLGSADARAPVHLHLDGREFEMQATPDVAEGLQRTLGRESLKRGRRRK